MIDLIDRSFLHWQPIFEMSWIVYRKNCKFDVLTQNLLSLLECILYGETFLKRHNLHNFYKNK